MNDQENSKEQLTYKGAVMTWECDSNGHMNVMYYINKFENAGRNFDLGFDDSARDKAKEGRVVVEQKINYLREVFEDDILYATSRLEGFSNKSMTIHHTMYHGKTHEIVATMRLVLVKFDKVDRRAIALSDQEKSILEQILKDP